MLMLRFLLSSAIPLSCCAFTAPHLGHEARTATSLAAINEPNSKFASGAIAGTLAGLALTAQIQMALAAPLVTPEATHQSPPSIDSSALLLSAGAFQPEAGYDDFSNGLTMPKYNIEDEATSAREKEVDPAKAEKLQAKADAAKAKAAAKKEAAAAKQAKAAAAEEAKLEANADKIAEKAAAKKRQMENMSEKQRAKIEAYEAEKAANKGKPSVTSNMARMYGLQ